jgi:chemotaxis protein CheD
MMRMPVDLYLSPGDLTVRVQPANVKTILGSCVAVCLWDPDRRIGGVNHYLLPIPVGEGTPDNRFGLIAIPALVSGLTRHGATAATLRAAIVGGGHPAGAVASTHIGDLNAALADTLLGQCGILVVTRHTGGGFGRKLLFNTGTGELIVRRLGQERSA